MEIIYLEDNDETPRTRRPRVPQEAPKRGAYRPPVPRGSEHTAWFICTNDLCPKAGHVATGKNTPTKVEKKGKCGDCRGLGIRVDEDGDQCETCHGSGRKVLKATNEVLPVKCPHCREAMEFLQEGSFPVGYPRMETAHSDTEGELQGNVGFGRKRIVTDG